jgi:hypothetical protein
MFSKLNFIVPLNSNDKTLKIRNTNGLVVHMIKDPSCSIKHEGVNIYVKQSSESNLLTFNFSSTEEAADAHSVLRQNLVILSQNLGYTPGPGPGPGPITPSNNCQCEDCDPRRSVVLLTDIWTESNLIPNTAPLSNSGVVQIVTDLPLIWQNGTVKFDAPTFIDIIPPYFGDGLSYGFVLKTSTGVVIPNGWQNWKVDLDCGTVCFKDGFVSTGAIIVDSTHPPKISFFKYIGNKGVFSGSGGGGNLQVSFNPPATVIGVDQNFNVPVAIQNILGFYINGQFIDNNISVQWVLNPSSTAPTTITWKGTADFVLDADDIVTIVYN